MNNRNGRRARIIALGACAVCAQTLFIREILGILTGTELILGFALASWLFWIGAGGLIGGRLIRFRIRSAERAFAGLSVSLVLSVPIVLLFIRAGRSLLVDPPGSIPDILPAAGLILVSTAPFGLLYGAVYNSASAVIRDPGKDLSSGISSAYILEAAGSIAGAALLSLLFFTFFTQLASAFAVSAVVTAVFLVTTKGRRFGWGIVLVFAAAGFAAAPQIDKASMSLVFSGYDVMEVVPSKYAELCVMRNRETVSVFSGGARLLSHPDPEAAGERIHIPLLAHVDPASVLLIGGGTGGGAGEALGHPGVERVDWIELDGKVPEVMARVAGNAAGTGGAGEEDPAVRGLTGDGRFLLRRSGPYDVIILNVPEPVNLRWNRYFTREFFETARRSLSPGGILTLRHGSSENFISEGNAAVLGMIRETLASSFEHVDIVPGGTVIFIASDSPVDVAAIPGRLLERGLDGHLLTLDELPWRITEERMEFLAGALAEAPRMINTDLQPLLVSRELILQGERSGFSSPGLPEGLFELPRWVLPAVFLAAAILIGSLAGGGGIAKSAVFLTGLCSMTVQVTLMLAYQSFSGILYHSLVLMTALFMAGAALGAFVSGIRLKDRSRAGGTPENDSSRTGGIPKKNRSRAGGTPKLSCLHIVMAVVAVLVPVWLRLQSVENVGQMTGTAGFMFLSMAGGLLTGAYYRTVVETAWPESEGTPPALFYSWDLFGACVGGLLAGTLLIPFSGLVWTAVTVAAVHSSSAFLLARKISPVR